MNGFTAVRVSARAATSGDTTMAPRKRVAPRCWYESVPACESVIVALACGARLIVGVGAPRTRIWCSAVSTFWNRIVSPTDAVTVPGWGPLAVNVTDLSPAVAIPAPPRTARQQTHMTERFIARFPWLTPGGAAAGNWGHPTGRLHDCTQKHR